MTFRMLFLRYIGKAVIRLVDNVFYCRFNEDSLCYETVVCTKHQLFPLIKWNFFTAGVNEFPSAKRCEQVSSKFKEASNRGLLTVSNDKFGNNVICASTENQNEKNADPPLSALEEDLLSAIGNKEKYGLEIAKALTDANEGAREFSPGSLYPTLRRLEGKGYLNSRWGEDDDKTETRGGARRRYYQITDSGLKKLRQTRQFRNRLISENYAQSLVCPCP